MKISIDQEGCIECAACEQACSEVFVVESGQKASIVENYRKNAPDVGEVPDSLGYMCRGCSNVVSCLGD